MVPSESHTDVERELKALNSKSLGMAKKLDTVPPVRHNTPHVNHSHQHIAPHHHQIPTAAVRHLLCLLPLLLAPTTTNHTLQPLITHLINIMGIIQKNVKNSRNDLACLYYIYNKEYSYFDGFIVVHK